MKLVSWFGGNPQRQLPALIGTILVFDSETGAPTGLISASQITGMRTGAASAIGSKYLARPDSRTLLLVGCGAQAPFQVMAHLEVFSGLERVLVYNPLAFDNARSFCEEIPGVLQRRFIDRIEAPQRRAELQQRAAIPFQPVESLPAALQQADIVITITPSRKPIIESAGCAPARICPAWAPIWPASRKRRRSFFPAAVFMPTTSPSPWRSANVSRRFPAVF